MNAIQLPNINQFIDQFVTKRRNSLFEEDLNNYHDHLKKEIFEKTVLVIGGAGTIGSSFIKEILKFRPKCLHVVDTNENGLTELTRHLRSSSNQFIPNDYKTYPMNFGSNTFEKIFKSQNGYNIVANFAAHKHVRSEKDPYAIEAMIENNVFMSKNLLDLILEYKSEHFFCVSTDKATNPVNIMGASKKLMENTIMAYRKDYKITTAIFANVAFYNGSLLYLYIHRLLQKQPISCPSDVKRYFVSPIESGQICLLACILGKSGDIFFPKLKESQMRNFKKITEDFLNCVGLLVDYCDSEEEAKSKLNHSEESPKYPVYFFKTDTSGEKLFEEFYSKNDQIDLNRFQNLGIIKTSSLMDKEKLMETHRSLSETLNKEDVSKKDIVSNLKEILPDFMHSETGKNLDQKM